METVGNEIQQTAQRYITSGKGMLLERFIWGENRPDSEAEIEARSETVRQVRTEITRIEFTPMVTKIHFEMTKLISGEHIVTEYKTGHVGIYVMNPEFKGSAGALDSSNVGVDRMLLGMVLINRATRTNTGYEIDYRFIGTPPLMRGRSWRHAHSVRTTQYIDTFLKAMKVQLTVPESDEVDLARLQRKIDATKDAIRTTGYQINRMPDVIVRRADHSQETAGLTALKVLLERGICDGLPDDLNSAVAQLGGLVIQQERNDERLAGLLKQQLDLLKKIAAVDEA